MNITSGKVLKAQKTVIYGPEGIGKSTFASHFPNPLFSDTEGSTTHLDVHRFDKPSSWSMLMAQVEYVKQNKPCSTYVIDTIDWAESLAKAHVISSSSDARIKSIEDFGYGKGYTMLAEEVGKLLNKLQEVVDVGINVVVLAHAMMRKFEQPQEVGAYDRWELKLEKKVAPLVKEWADALLFATYEIHVVNVDNQGAAKGKNKAQGGSRVMYTIHNPAWDAKNRWSLQEKLDFNFTEIAEHIPNMLKTEVKETKTEVNKTQESGYNQFETKKGHFEKEGASPVVETLTEEYPRGPLGDLMRTSQVSVDELMNYVIKIAQHFPEGTKFETLPVDYTDGALIANWEKVVASIKITHNKNPETY